MSTRDSVVILGAGVAGLAAGFYARRQGLAATIFEASPTAGGNARTLTCGDFRFDTGAHRFHDQNPAVTADVQALLGDDLAEVQAPSRILWNGRWVDFPLTPVNLAQSLGPLKLGRAVWDLGRSRVGRAPAQESFESVAVRAYGRTVADLFLLGYSEKLWGVPCRQLEPAVAGRRLQGLTAAALVRAIVNQSRKKSEHLEGRFWYPTLGIGMIAERLADACAADSVRLNSRVTQIRHHQGRITTLEVNGQERLDVSGHEVVSTLPIGVVTSLFSPALPDAIIQASRSLRFRHVVLVTLFINRASVSPNATVYCPDAGVPFTRITEPRNRSRRLAPAGQTSLSIEIPCWSTDAVWATNAEQTIEQCASLIARLQLVDRGEIVGGVVHKLPYAYPVLEIGSAARVELVQQYLGSSFENLTLAGRSGRFAYVHVHDLIDAGRGLVERLVAKPAPALTGAAALRASRRKSS